MGQAPAGPSYEEMIGYNDLDPVKRAATKRARETDGNIADTGLKVVEWSRGESVFLVEHPDYYMGSLVEGLGTKNKVAEARREALRMSVMVARGLRHELGPTFADKVAQCNCAMFFNDMSTLNVRPLVANMHWAVGDSAFLKDEQMVDDLISGTKHACDLAGCVWGGGETPTLRGIIYPDTMVLSGAAYGWANPKSSLITPSSVVAGDRIYIIKSPGICANGLTMARAAADLLPDGYFTLLSDGRTYGEALLTPTTIVAPVIRDLVEAGADLRYTVNVTGHGWRKLMRLDAEFSYIVDEVPEPQEEFKLIADVKGQTPRQMYETFNMGGHFALYAPASSWDVIEKTVSSHDLEVMGIGEIEAGPRRVVIRPLGLEWTAEELGVR